MPGVFNDLKKHISDISLPRKAHEVLSPHIKPGSLALDATCGNGHDTLFLAGAVGCEGRVLACDIQPLAIEKTRARLTEAGLNDRVQCQLSDHAQIEAWLPPDWKNNLGAVMFNFGYLPGGDKAITTRAQSSLTAVRAAWDNLGPGGCLSILLYRGHPGGPEEADAILHWAGQSVPANMADYWESTYSTTTSPLWLFILNSAA